MTSTPQPIDIADAAHILGRQEYRVLRRLAAEPKAIVPHEDLIRALELRAPSKRPDKMLRVVICNIRIKLPKVRIESFWGAGYALYV